MPEIEAQPQAAIQPQVSLKTTALQFLRWAHTHNLLSPDAYYPGDGFDTPDFGIKPPTGETLGYLRARQIRFAGVDSATGKLLVFLRRAAPPVKELRELPSTCNGFSLTYHQGVPENLNAAAVADATSTCGIHSNAAGSYFYTCGSSISVGNNREAGTLGCLVRDAEGKLYGLSNNHVSGACSYAPTGLPVLAPGIVDVVPTNPRPFTLGIHTRQLPMQVGDPSSIDHTLNSDAAIFEIVAATSISSMQRTHYDTPLSVLDPIAGMMVEKVGRTTGYTKGTVMSEVIGPTGISYVANQYNFAGQIYLEPMLLVHGIGDVFSDSGDSGSLVTHVDAAGVRHAVGLVVAGCVDGSAPGGKRSLILPIRQILDRLEVSLVSGHNV